MSTLDNPNAMIDPQDVSPRPIGVRYGLIIGLALIVLGLIFQVTGLVDPANPQSSTNWISSIVNYGLMIAGLVIAMRTHRDEQLGGFMTFGRGFSVGLWFSLIVALISMVWMFIYFGLIDPDMIERMMEAQREMMIEQQGMSEEQVDQAMQITGFMRNPVIMSVIGGVSMFVMGLIFSLIVGAIMKKNPPEAAI